MNSESVFQFLTTKVGDSVYDYTPGPIDPFFKVKAVKLLEVAKLLRDEETLKFDFLNNITAVDWIKLNRIDVVYHLWSYPLAHECIFKVELPRENPVIESLAGLWKSADWNEREQYDLFGVQFLHHPDLRRILMPDDWVGYPMRKDYKESDDYRGMSTTRANTIELLPIYDKASPEKRNG